MTNEEIIEEIYWAAHKYGVFNEFISEVNKRETASPRKDRIVYVEEVYREYRNSGVISSGRDITHQEKP